MKSTGITANGPQDWKAARDFRDQLIEKTKTPEPVPTSDARIGEIARLYLAVIGNSTLDTRKQNVNALYRILRFHFRRCDIDTIPVEAINDAVDSYRAKSPTKPVSINTNVHMAQAIFARHCLSYYKKHGFDGLEIDYFLGLRPLKTPQPSGYVDPRIIDEISRAAISLDGNLRKAYLLVRYCALRNKEVYLLRNEDLKETAGRYWIDPSWTKTGQRRQIPISEGLFKELKGVGEFVLEGSEFERKSYVNRVLSKWLRQFVPMNYQKTVYLLRRRCIKEMREIGEMLRLLR